MSIVHYPHDGYGPQITGNQWARSTESGDPPVRSFQTVWSNERQPASMRLVQTGVASVADAERP